MVCELYLNKVKKKKCLQKKTHFFTKLLKNNYLRQRARARAHTQIHTHKVGREGEGGAGTPLSREPGRGLDRRTPGPQPEMKADA